MSSNFADGVILTLTEMFGDYGAKVQNPALSYVSYVALSYELQSMMKEPRASIALANAYWDGISNIMTMAMGYYMGEQLTTIQWSGCFLISAGIFLLAK